jgi:hypothetical protein
MGEARVTVREQRAHAEGSSQIDGLAERLLELLGAR